jgi:hypothetical protein
MQIQKITLEIPRCHDIVAAETSKSKNPSFLDVMNRFGDMENVIRSVPKRRKRART